MLGSIKLKVLVSQMILIVIVTVVTGVSAYYIMKGRLLTLQSDKLKFIAESEARDIRNQFESKKNLFATITSDEVLESYQKTYSELAMAEHFSKFTGDFSDLSYASFSGTEQFRLLGGELTGDLRDISDTVLFQDATWFPGKIFASDVYPGPTGVPSVSVAVARETFFGESVGVITATLPVDSIAPSVDSSSVGESGFITIVDMDGTVLSHPRSEMNFKKLKDDGDVLQLVEQARDLEKGFSRTTLFGTDSLIASAPVEGTNWTVLSVLPYQEFIAGPNVLRNYLAAASAIILFIVSILALFAVRGTTRALTGLSEAAKAIAGGDLNQRVFTGSGDEVGVLANSFNTMAEQLERSYRSLHNLSAHLLSVREDERKAVAREVHDELGQVLSTLKIDLVWLQKRLPEERDDLTERAQSMRELIDSTIDIVQNITAELRPLVLDDLGLAAAIESEAGNFHERTGIKCEAHVEDFATTPDVSSAVFRVFQESLLNVIRHSDATRVKVDLRVDDGTLHMEIKDNGKGITSAEVNAPTSFGLMGMRERILALGGTLDIEGKYNMGTMVSVKVPVKGNEADKR